jgi:HCOMODA/2-hydroxy-3-carboxy-muconic semialdehyde decarboxylase
MSESEAELRGLLTKAAQVLSGLGLVQGHGHLSSLVDDDHGQGIICTPRAAPSLATASDMIRFSPEDLRAHATRLPVEAIMHTSIYACREDVGAIVRVHSPLIDALGSRLKSIGIVHGRGSHLRNSPWVFDDPSPISTVDLGLAVTELLADRQAVVLRGNGAVIVGNDIPDAVANASYLLETVTIHLAGGVAEAAKPFTSHEIGLRGGAMRGDSSNRTWDYLVSVT